MGTTSDHHLAIDIGNSGVKAAVFRFGEMIGQVIRFSDQQWEKVNELVTNHGVKNIIYSTVANVPPQRWIDTWESEDRLVLALTTTLTLPFKSVYETMHTLGHDRIAVVAGSLAPAASMAPATAPKASRAAGQKAARLIVDAGTCVTLDLVDAEGTYLGGNISPGLHLRLKAMHTFTARLPLVEAGEVKELVGRSTAAALRHGGQLGVVYEIEGLYHRLRTVHPSLQLLLTGGDGEWIAAQLSIPCCFNPNLVLLGLNQILSNYVQNES